MCPEAQFPSHSVIERAAVERAMKNVMRAHHAQALDFNRVSEADAPVRLLEGTSIRRASPR
jgi:hypothetical protein